VNNCPTCENSPNLVTLVAILGSKIGAPPKASTFFRFVFDYRWSRHDTAARGRFLKNISSWERIKNFF
jgi:hypothetical protein